MAKGKLELTLAEEKAADAKLTSLAEGGINQVANDLAEDDEQDDDEDASAAMASSSKGSRKAKR